MSALPLQGRKVFGVGLSRTGTSSLADALNTLGIRTIHYPNDDKTARELKRGDFRLTILEKYQGAVDIPIPAYFAQLDKVYPESKFILTVRDVDDWLASVENHWKWQEKAGRSEFTQFFHAAVYGCIDFNEDRYRYVFHTHCRNVEEYFRDRPADLLVVDIPGGDGWERVCPFLGLPVRTDPFPHANPREESGRWVRMLEAVQHEIETTVPSDSTLILVDLAKLNMRIADGRTVRPFLERDGVYFGQPADSATAIESLEAMRAEGAEFLVFGWPAFWMFDTYRDFGEYIVSRFACLRRTDELLVFDLR